MRKSGRESTPSFASRSCIAAAAGAAATSRSDSTAMAAARARAGEWRHGAPAVRAPAGHGRPAAPVATRSRATRTTRDGSVGTRRGPGRDRLLASARHDAFVDAIEVDADAYRRRTRAPARSSSAARCGCARSRRSSPRAAGKSSPSRKRTSSGLNTSRDSLELSSGSRKVKVILLEWRLRVAAAW